MFAGKYFFFFFETNVVIKYALFMRIEEENLLTIHKQTPLVGTESFDEDVNKKTNISVRLLLEKIGVVVLCFLLSFFVLLLFDFHLDAPIFCLCLCWISALFGGWLCDLISLPPLLGMLLAGLFLKNIPGGLVDELPASWASKIRAVGLALILLRSGLEIEFEVISKIGMLAFLLTVAPSTAEAISCGPLGHYFFDKMPLSLGWSMGFILSSVSGAVVIVLMFNLQREGWGRAKGIPTLIMAASSFDDIIAIGGYSIFITVSSAGALALFSVLAETGGDGSSIQPSLIVDGNGWGTVGFILLSGPVSFAAGMFIGGVIGFVCGMTRIFTSSLQIVIVAVCSTQLVMLISGKYGYDGIGAMTALGGGMTMIHAWKVGFPKFASSGPTNSMGEKVEGYLSNVWIWCMQPLLFVVIGSSVDLHQMDASTVPRALGLLTCSLLIRSITTWACLINSCLNFRERIYVTLAWLPKATIQAALSSAPLDILTSILADADDSLEGTALKKRYLKWGVDIQCTCLVSVLLTAPVGLILLTKLAPVLLTKDEYESVAYDDAVSVTSSTHSSHKGHFVDLEKGPIATGVTNAESVNVAAGGSVIWKLRKHIGDAQAALKQHHKTANQLIMKDRNDLKSYDQIGVWTEKVENELRQASDELKRLER